MARFFLTDAHFDENGKTVTIDGDDAHHICFSLRMAVGDEITVCDGRQNEYRAELLTLTGTLVTAKIVAKQKNDTELPCRVFLYQAMPKGEKMDFIVQKATELGVTGIVLVESARCIVRLDEKNREKKRQRYEKIAHEAAKQCGRGVLPTVASPVSFQTAAEQIPSGTLCLFCYEGDGVKSLKTVLTEHRAALDGHCDIAVFIGPEGGFEQREVQLAKDCGMILTGLGKRILRTETAPIAALAALVYELEA